MFHTVEADGERVRLSLVFSASAREVGLEGQGLEPGQCGWVERAFGEREPRRILLSIAASDSTPRRSMNDSAIYWGFLGYPTDSGHITVVGYRHWHASSPPQPHGAEAPSAAAAPVLDAAAPSRPSLVLPFDVRYLPLLAVGMGVIIGIPGVILMARGSGWRRLAESYPDRNQGRGRSVRSGQLVLNRTVYKMGARFTADESHLHVAISPLARLGHEPFSVPWPEVEATRDEWPWFPFKGEPMLRLTFAAHPEIRMLLRMRVGERIGEASDGRLTLQRLDVPAAEAAAHR